VRKHGKYNNTTQHNTTTTITTPALAQLQLEAVDPQPAAAIVDHRIDLSSLAAC
jgi:hypothetical protein